MSEQLLQLENAPGTPRLEPLSCSFYINACFAPPDVFDGISHELRPRPLPFQKLRNAVSELDLAGQKWLTTTLCGIIAGFSRHEDAERMFAELDLARILEGPVQVAMLPMTGPKTQASMVHPGAQTVIIRDVPWSLPIEELRTSLNMLGITTGEMERWRQHVRVEIKNIIHTERLVNEGLDFYGIARFPVTLERTSTGQGDHQHQSCVGDADILQCYRCQGFWHVAANCRHLPRCVRCGEPHGVEFCLRLRSNPMCCNCSGPHHAAYKQCPVRKQMSQAAPVSFTLSKKRPTERLGAISSSTVLNKSSCLL